MLVGSRLRLTALVAVVGLSSFLGFAPPAALAANEPLPECRYDDVLTRHGSVAEWRISVLDTIFALRKDYKPGRLVSTSQAGLAGDDDYVRAIVIPDLGALARAARKANAGVRIVSAYRSYKDQQEVFDREVRARGVEHARLKVARPGHSEHQLGTTIDFGSAKSTDLPWGNSDWAQTPSGAWMKANAWKYGFVLSYPRDSISVTCYAYEPWHYRYVGRQMAARVRASGLTLRQYLWKNF